jgi:hypothetical protein
MKGQTALCQDLPMKSVVDHNKIERLSKENAIKHKKKVIRLLLKPHKQKRSSDTMMKYI